MPAGGTQVIEAEFLSPQKLNFNSSRAELGSKSFLQSATADGATSIKVDITGQPQNTWDISVHQKSSAKVNKNDALVASFWLRGKAKSGQAGAVTEFVFERAGAPYTLSLIHI